jgi:hypothetical protein
MSTVAQDRAAERVITTVVNDLLGKTNVESVRVYSADDHTGEPALYVLIDLTHKDARPSGVESIGLVKAMRDALQDIDDDRFPYVSFSAPGDEQAEDTRSAA